MAVFAAIRWITKPVISLWVCKIGNSTPNDPGDLDLTRVDIKFILEGWRKGGSVLMNLYQKSCKAREGNQFVNKDQGRRFTQKMLYDLI